MHIQNSELSRSRCVRRAAAGVVGLVLAGWTSTASAAPYASGVKIEGTTVSFTLNESADTLTYSLNGGPAQTLDGSAAGTKSFTLSSPTDKFSIVARKNDTAGYTIKTGGTAPAAVNGLSQTTDLGGFRPISDDANPFTQYNSPRGVSVVLNPNLSTFGTTYISNSAVGGTRALGDGIYAVKADQSDAFGYGTTAQNPSIVFDNAGGNSPYRVTVAPNGEVYVADYDDSHGNVYRLNSTLTTAQPLLTGMGGTATSIPAGSKHGSVSGVFVTGSSAGGDLVLYTLDEDLKSSYLGGAAGDDRNSLWKYEINGATTPYDGTPKKVNQANVLVPASNSDLDRGADGKFYLAQQRSNGAESGLVVLNSAGSMVYNSLQASRDLLGNQTAADILRQVVAVAVSPDQKYVALMLNSSDVAVLPLVDGLPDLANRILINTGTDIISGRDIAFDAANNIHYVSSGQQLYRVLSPGGDQMTTLSYDGANYSFVVGVPEPGSLALLGLAGLVLGRRRRTAR